jgi:HAD domain in Swiss Army Knife RNA repair proteins
MADELTSLTQTPASTAPAVMTAPVLFLNLEGTVHPWDVGYIYNQRLPDEPRPFCWSEHLRQVIEEWNLDIVLRSSATTFVREEILLSQMPLWLRQRLRGFTQPTHVPITLDWIRKFNTSYGVIRNYVKANVLTHWVALADDADGWPEAPEIRRHLVQCDGEVGVTDPVTVKRLEGALVACRP